MHLLKRAAIAATLLAVVLPLEARAPRAVTPPVARLLCDAALFTGSPTNVQTLLRTRLGVVPVPGDGPGSFTFPAHASIREGQLDFQAGDELYGPSVPKAPRLRMLRLVIRATPGAVLAIRRGLDRCAGHPPEIDGTSATWSLPHRRLIGIDRSDSWKTEFTASVDQSDVAE